MCRVVGRLATRAHLKLLLFLCMGTHRLVKLSHHVIFLVGAGGFCFAHVASRYANSTAVSCVSPFYVSSWKVQSTTE